MDKLQKFEKFLKDVQNKYQDEFTDLQEINTRYSRLVKTNKTLKKRHQSSGGEMEVIFDSMDKFKKQAGIASLEYTNKIAEEQAALQQIEHEKAKLMIGNEEKTEHRLKTTSEHGIILMSIKSLY